MIHLTEQKDEETQGAGGDTVICEGFEIVIFEILGQEFDREKCGDGSWNSAGENNFNMAVIVDKRG